MKISEFLNKENNNLDLARILLACLVIIGHSKVLNGTGGYWIDPIEHFFGFTYSGAFAVKLFLFISGLVVANSYFNKRSPVYFIVSRIFRILPALLFVLLVTVFIFGPLLTKYTASDYFSQLNNFAYIWHNIVFYSDYYLPGVFTDNLYPDIVNGSLWSLRYEVGCYAVLLLLLLILGNRNKKYFIIPILLIIIDSLLPTRYLLRFIDNNPEKYLLPLFFSYGVLFAVFKEKIKITFCVVILSILFFLIFKDTSYADIVLVLTSCNVMIYLSSRVFILKLKPKYDISYGIYLWGFLIQQILFHLLGPIYIGFHAMIAIFVSIFFAYLSYVYVEMPFMKMGKSIIRLYVERRGVNKAI